MTQWIPLAVTVTAVAVGIAAWVWSERRDSDDEVEDQSEHDEPRPNDRPPTHEHAREQQQSGSALHPLNSSDQQPPSTLYARMTNVINRAPSPQQFLSDTSKRMAAGVAAAGAVVWPSKTLDFRDHQRWQEEEQIRAAEALLSTQQTDRDHKEAETHIQKSANEVATDSSTIGVVTQQGRQSQAQRAVQGRGKTAGKRKIIAVVVSSVEVEDDDDATTSLGRSLLEQLKHTPMEHYDTDLLVLIYAPHLTSYPSSLTAQSQSAMPDISAPTLPYAKLEAQALSLVPHPAHILPFTTPTGCIHLLRHLAPNVVYVQEDLVGGRHTDHLGQLKGWVGQTVLVTSKTASGSAAKTSTKGVEVVQVDAGLEEHFAKCL